MKKYQLIKDSITNEPLEDKVIELESQLWIPFELGNTDYQRFKNEIRGIGEMGTSITPVELQDVDGNTMTEEEIADFIETLP